MSYFTDKLSEIKISLKDLHQRFHTHIDTILSNSEVQKCLYKNSNSSTHDESSDPSDQNECHPDVSNTLTNNSGI